MKKILLILTTILLMSTTWLFSQDISPLPSITVKKLVAPNTPVFYYDQADSSVWVYKGTYGWTKLADSARLQKDFVPYENAWRDVNLNTKTILAEGQQLPLSNGGCIIPTFTDNGNGTVTIGDGDYHLSANVSGKGSHNYTIVGGTYTMTDLSQNYIVADYNGGSPIIRVITDVTLINETTIVPVYSVFRNAQYLHTQNWDALGIALSNKIHQSIVKTQRYRRESGLALSEYGTRNLALTVGRIWTGAVPISLDAIATATDGLFLWYHSGGTWTSTLLTQYNNTQYDNGTDLVTLTAASRYAVNWVFRGVESQKHLYIVLGTSDYTEVQADNATLPAIPVAISSHAVLVAKLIVQKSALTATSIQSAFDVQFGLSAIQAHGDLTGRDVIDSHPAGAITFTPLGTYTATTVADALYQIDAKTPDRSITNEIQSPTRVGDIIGLTQTSTTISIADKLPSANISGTSGYISKFTGTNSLGNSPIWTDGTNVGIGIILPDAKLHINGEFESHYGVKITSNFGTGRTYGLKSQGGNADVLSLFDVTSGFRLSYFGYNQFGLATNNITRLSSDNNGVITVSNLVSTNSRPLLVSSTGQLTANPDLSSGSLPYWDGTKFVNSNELHTTNGLRINRAIGQNSTLEFYSGNFRPYINAIDGNLNFDFVNPITSQINDETISGIRFFTNNNLTTPALMIKRLGEIKIQNLASTNARLLSASSTGQLTAITDGTNGQVLTTNGSGVYSFTTPSGGATNLSYSTTTSTVNVISDTGTDAILPAATQSNAGVLNTVDKTKIDNLWITTPQALSGTTPTWNVLLGINATLTLTGNTTITLSNIISGMTGNITVINAASVYEITVSGYTNKISQAVYTTANKLGTSGNSKVDVFSWYYDGTYLIWNGSNDYK